MYIGYSSAASMDQAGGTVTIAGDLYISGNCWNLEPDGVGAYELSAGQLTTTYTVIGYMANGTFTQSGGTHTTQALILNGPGGSIGTYSTAGGTLDAGVTYNVQKPSPVALQWLMKVPLIPSTSLRGPLSGAV